MKKSTKPKSRTVKQTKKTIAHRHRLGGWRFLPAIAIAMLATFFAYQPSVMRSPTRGVLAYATNVSVSGLLASTNTQRSANGAASLNANSQLNSAAQAKAQDMATRGYWSHETPDGKQPWTFITSAGYQYKAAGENLAYGYMTSDSTLTGWMNSPPHRTNLLSSNFTEVGFGIANSPDYCYTADHDSNPSTPHTSECKGQQTIVVAMYAAPLSSAPVAAAKPPTTPKQTKPAATPVQEAPAAAPVIEQTPVQEEAPVEKEEEVIVTASADSDIPITTATSTEIGYIQLLTNGWLSMTAVILAICAIGVLWVLHKGFHLRRYVVAGEHFAAKHLHIDLAVLSVVYLGFVMLSSSGVVR